MTMLQFGNSFLIKQKFQLCEKIKK